MTRPQVLVISFSPIASDSRVLREISAIARVADVTTVGYGPKPPHTVSHLSVPSHLPSLPQTVGGVFLAGIRHHRRAEMAAPALRAAADLIGDKRFDIVVANDARAIPLAFRVAHGAPIWADMHEYAPEEQADIWTWRTFVSPLMDYICRTYLKRCAAVTTVGQGIADLYLENYGVRPRLVRNTGELRHLSPTPVSPNGPIRLVHSGIACQGRNLDVMIEAVIAAGDGLTLDLYLVQPPREAALFKRITELADSCERVTLHPPVRPEELPATLNQYDAGIYWIPPVNTNNRLALPNKIFDFIQARLALVVGPTIEMRNIIEQYGNGYVSDSFERDDIIATLKQLNRDDIAAWKAASDQAARELNFEFESTTIIDIIHELSSAPTAR